jgi:hypothetical protein
MGRGVEGGGNHQGNVSELATMRKQIRRTIVRERASMSLTTP